MVVSKIYSHFASSAKRTEELKSVFNFVAEDYQSIQRHVPTRWLSLWPAVNRLHSSWPAIKSYFLSLGEEQCPKSLWQLFKDDQDGEGNPLELQVYLSFLNNALKIFHDIVLLLEREDATVCELYDMMFTLKTKLQQRQIDGFFGVETDALLQVFPNQQAAAVKHDMCNFYQVSLAYLEQRYDFTDSSYQKKLASLALLKSPFTFSQLCDAVTVLHLGKKLDMDALYDEHCVVLPRQQAVIESGAPVVEKWAALLKQTDTPNLTAFASFLFSLPITNASVERVFSLMAASWTDTRNRCSVELIKSEIQVKSNFKLRISTHMYRRRRLYSMLHVPTRNTKSRRTLKMLV
ncbi:uncharacterized protein LOC121646098 [Melanotaenia boesemani]|uniref:uncharacterized protein LOC121646098 n=1 Tax=Melanotaenia boesemani TaxID=1250792 RepID=UPI001C042A14|nr:uncharacterized protein LOC121646098 [Melanotaenia boesemani]